jgi:undecaprenyl-diphosphatase
VSSGEVRRRGAERQRPAPKRAGVAVLPRLAVLAAIWAGLTGLLVAAGEIVTNSAAVTDWDRGLTSDAVASRTPALNTAMKIVTWLGSWVALAAAAAIVLLLVLTRRLPAVAAIVAVLAWAGEAGGVRIAKETITRARPPQAIWLVNAHGWSFPSGHAATASLAFTAMAACVAVLTASPVVRAAGWLVAVLAVAATAYSRVELGVHWTTDVIASVVFVAAWLAAIAIITGGLLRPAEPPPAQVPLRSGEAEP